MKQKVKKKKYRVKYQNILIFLLVTYLLFVFIGNIINQDITNIYIINNTFLSDQEIIEISELTDYPNTLSNSCKKIQERLENNIYIKSVNVYKKNITEVYIEVEENRPLFYRASVNKTVLLDGSEVSEKFAVPILINYIPDTIYNSFITKMANINTDILKRISEIEYNPNDVDDERFLLSMIDDNYVYLTIYKFDSINNYIDIIKNFENKKGILYLDSGEYFKVIDE